MTTLTSVARVSSAPTAASSPIRPILRKPTSVLGTRSRSDDSDGADDDEPPTKRQKKTVVFNEELNMVKEISSKSLEEAKREVKQALEGHSRGDDEDYDNLKETFSPSPKRLTPDDDEEEASKPQDLVVYVVALTGYAPLIGRSCSGLLRSILRCAWLERDEYFAKAYIQLLAALSSVQGSFLTQVLTMMVDKFTATRHASSVPGFEPVDSETKKNWLHVGLKYLLELFPAGQNIMLKLVTEHFPYTEASKAIHMEYIDHLLRLKAARPELERDIMELILSRLVKLDVEMALDLENDDDETTRAVLRQLENSDVKDEDEDDESDADSVLSEEDDLNEQAKRVLTIKSKLETMDAILDLLFSIYTPVFENPDSPEAIEAFQDLLSDFCNVILPNLKSRHTQYLLFKFALKSNQLMEMFIGTLFNIAFESNRQPVIKQAAVAYLASFTARGARVQSEQVQMITKTFLDYIDLYRAGHTSCRGPDVRRYSQYYHIFCFRWRDLIDRDRVPPSLDWDDPASFIGQDLPWMAGLKSRLQANIASKLNPLKCCSPVIVDEFARLSHHLRLIYIYPQIEKNKSVHLSQFFTGSYATGGALRDTGLDFDDQKWTHLEACFPFDPFQLPVAKRWLDLQNSYVTWQPMALLDRDNGDLEEGDEDEEESEVDVDDIMMKDSANPDPDPRRPSFKSFWQKSKQALGARTVRFVNGNPAGARRGSGEGAGAQDVPPTNKPAPDKAQLRRAQVRRAQIQHRQRKASYVKQLEMDIARIREMIEAAERESQVLLNENQAMRAQIRQAVENKSLPMSLDQRVSLLDEMPQPSQLSSDTIASLPQELEDITITLGFDEHICRDHFDPSLYSPPPPDEPLPPRSPFGFLGHDSNGHTLMATALALRNAPAHIFKAAARTRPLPGVYSISRRPSAPPPPHPSADDQDDDDDDSSGLSWKTSGLTLRSLYGLACSLNPPLSPDDDDNGGGGGCASAEIAPVQAWFELVTRFGAATLMREGVLDRLKREFVGVVKCPHFGASMKRGAFETVVAGVLGKGGC
ncbi:RNA polymerase I-specific transcription initiation factor RRN3-domain-containing protein [Achaetomium macrosporum]|uniref:RNA polymerase I-specific transcription initiation factor RRN3-domain-containing protein n=1 Tax=Achaetomium macrosporum TaxID=79813 RepID=A0AAN7C8F3_9PEZI|nr:RNA polymerase I-specific transcription initiation factor RRN3-domain-containing protein [Achaetomium macrosporum]